MAAGDVTIHGTSRRTVRGLREVWGTVQLDGANPTPVALGAYIRSVLGGVVSLEGATAPGLDPTTVTAAVSGGSTLNVYAWKPTASDNATLIASTDNSRLVHFRAWGIP
jgi:hypothetical protein